MKKLARLGAPILSRSGFALSEGWAMRGSIEGVSWAAPPRLSPTLPEASSERALRSPTLKGSGHPGLERFSGLSVPRQSLKFRPPPTPVGGGWPKAGRGLLESSQRIRGPQARFKLVVSGLIWATAQPSTESPSRPVGAPSPKSEILGRASIESLWFAAPPRLSPTLPEASSERALRSPTLNGPGHRWGRTR
mgnify:CR=1 FL=1